MQQEDAGMLLVFSLTVELQCLSERVAQNLIVYHMAMYSYLIQQIANLLSDFKYLID